MSIVTNRIIHSDNGSLIDLSLPLNDIVSGTSSLPIVAAQDALYIGSIYPFSSRYFSIGTVNALASTVSVYLWDSSTWTAAVDVIDGTKLTGATFGQNGTITWRKNKNAIWVNQDTSEITGLTSLNIYGLYWAKLVFSADFTPGCVLKYVGHRFANEGELGSFYPELILASTKTDFETGKTSWDDQLTWATEITVRDLKLDQKIVTPDLLLDGAVFVEAVVHKTAEIIYTAFGKDWVEQKTEAGKAYKAALNVGVGYIDRNQNTLLDSFETRFERTVVRR
jgi:hypothetical protein